VPGKSRTSEARHKYGILAAGAVSGSLIGRLNRSDAGPVCAVSYRVASRIANTLQAGYAVQSANELGGVAAVLVYAPQEKLSDLSALLENAAIDWKGRALIFCDCHANPEMRRRFRDRGASTAEVREFGVPARLIVEGADGVALKLARQIARQLQLKPVTISPGSANLFEAAVTLGGAAITPIIDRAAALLRSAGMRQNEAARMASSIFERTAREFAHSGKQSWAWYLQNPETAELEAQIAAAGPETGGLLRELVRFGMEGFSKYRADGRR
jgi:hypothetical protein